MVGAKIRIALSDALGLAGEMPKCSVQSGASPLPPHHFNDLDRRFDDGQEVMAGNPVPLAVKLVDRIRRILDFVHPQDSS